MSAGAVRPLLVAAVLAWVAGCGAHRLPVGATSHPDRAMQAELERLASDVPGEVGIYVRHLGTGAMAAVRPDELFPTASMIKLPILATLYDRVERGTLRMDSVLVFDDSLRYSDEDVIGELRAGATVTPHELAVLVATLSDNSAALWLQGLVGGGAAVNEWLAGHGFASTRVNSRTPGRRPDWELYGWGQTTPREIAELLVAVRQSRVLRPATSDGLFRLLTRNVSGAEGTATLPPTVVAATKEGAVDRSRSQVLLVAGPSGEYVVAVAVRNLAEVSWTPGNPGWVLIERVSRAVYRHFNPDDPWLPPREYFNR